ncbi:MAG: DUF1232 domain-containing protein [Polyangiaceae bacterium]
MLRPKGLALRDAVRILPDTLRLVRRLAADATLPRAIRVRLAFLLFYLALPFDLIPDFIPVIGHADDVVVTVVVLRSVVRKAGLAVIRSHWPGTSVGLDVLLALCGLPTERADGSS